MIVLSIERKGQRMGGSAVSRRVYALGGRRAAAAVCWRYGLPRCISFFPPLMRALNAPWESLVGPRPTPISCAFFNISPEPKEKKTGQEWLTAWCDPSAFAVGKGRAVALCVLGLYGRERYLAADWPIALRSEFGPVRHRPIIRAIAVLIQLLAFIFARRRALSCLLRTCTRACWRYGQSVHSCG